MWLSMVFQDPDSFGLASGHYAAGRKIPSVRALMEEFSVSSQTVQRALRLLQEARAVTAIHGSGVFVNASIVPTFAPGDDFSGGIDQTGTS